MTPGNNGAKSVKLNVSDQELEKSAEMESMVMAL